MKIGENKEKMLLIKEVDSLNSQLTQVLIERSDTIKEARYLERKYTSIMGQYLIERYQAFFEYEKMVRMIEIYQRALNHEETITDEEVNEIIARETKEYENKLNEIIDDYSSAKSYMNSDTLSSSEYQELKEVYRYIVKIIHPDLNPNLGDEFITLWHMTQKAYTTNNLPEILIIKDILDNKEIIRKEYVNELEELRNTVDKLKAMVNQYLLEIAQMKKGYPFDQLEIMNNESLLQAKKDEIISHTNEFKSRIDELSIHM